MKVNIIEINFERLIDALGQIDETDPKLAEGQIKLGEHTVWRRLFAP